MTRDAPPFAVEFKKGSDTKRVSSATVNRELTTLKKILNMAVDDELIARNPCRKVQPFPEEIPDVHILTFEEELKYLALAPETLKTVSKIMLGQGMRPDEVFRMTYEKLDFVNRTILIVRGKTRNAKRTLSMCQEVFDLLKKRREKYPNEYWVFPSPVKPGNHITGVRKSHDRVCARIGLRGVIDLYNLRHTFATRSILSGTDVTILQKILGHSEIGMTMRYVKNRRALQGRSSRTVREVSCSADARSGEEAGDRGSAISPPNFPHSAGKDF